MVMIKASEHDLARPRWARVSCISPAGLHEMAYQEWGDPSNPDTVVCVHGLTRLSQDFNVLAKHLSARYRVVCPDVVGRGRSSWLKNPMLYGVPQYAADMITLIARLNVPKVKWVGTSMGGLIGMTLASLQNSPIERLILNDVGASLSGEALARIASYVGLVTHFPDRETAHKALREIFSGFGPHSDDEWHDLIDPGLVADAEGKGVRVHYDPAIAEPFRQTYSMGAMVPNLELWPVYDAIQCPTLLLRGAQSDLCTQAVAEAMSHRGPRAHSVAFAGVGHAPSLMHDDQIQVVSQFLSSSP